MAKKTRKAVVASNSGAMCTCVCGHSEHVKMAAGFKFLMALAILGFAGGVLSLNLAAWVVGLLVLIKGLMAYKSTMG